MRSRKSTFVALALVIFLAPALRAQELFNGNQTGLPPFGSFHGTDFENVSLANGNLHVEIPIQTVPQRVIKPARIMYVYDAVAWNIYWIPVDPGDPLAPGYYVINNPQAHKDGWRLGDDAGVSAYGYDMTQVLCTAKTPNFNYTLFSNYTLKQSNGTKHGVPLRKEGSGAPANCLGEILSGPTTDGTGYVATIAPGSPNITKILDKDGLVPTAGIDNNGNQVNTVDTLGRALLTPYDAPNITYTTLLNNTIQGPAYSTWTIKDSSGTSRIYRIDYVARDIQSNFCSIYPLTSYHCFEAGPLVVLLPAKLTLPSIGGPDRFYQFTWDNGAAASGLGNLTRIDLPTGGYIAYTYSSALFKTPFSGRYPPYSGRGSVTQRTVYDGAQSNTWLYSISSLGLGATVTRPSYNGLQDQEVHTLTGSVSGLTVGSTVESNVQYYAGSSASGTLLRTVTKDYLAEREPNTGHAANVRQIRETTTLENALVSKVETDYETFTYTALSTTGYCNPCTATRLNVSERREYAYGSGAAGALARKTDYGYLHSGNQPYIDRNIVSRVKLVSVYDGSGVLKAQTQSDYDIYNYSDMGAMQPSNAVQHDATNYGTSFIYRGNVTATKKWRNTDAAWLETRRQFDDAGNIIKTRDPLSHFTTFDYTDNWANSACAPVGQGKAYPKSVTNAMNQITLYSYNSCTGTVASATDPNNQATTFTYDFMDRPDITNFPDGGQVDNDYDDTNRVVTVKRKLTAGATIYSM